MIVLFSSGEYSDFGMQGLMELDPKVYQTAREAYEQLSRDKAALEEDLALRVDQCQITPDQVKEIVKQLDKIDKQRWNVWETCKQQGAPVAFTEFWYSQH